MCYIAFTLGLFGSLHCIGMCGPLAIAFSNRKGNSRYDDMFSALSYNLGRTTTYAFLGLIFGALGSFIFVAELQRVISIILGLLLIVSFLFAIDINTTLNNHPLIKSYYIRIRSLISKMMQKSVDYHPFQLGMANGLLPCGLVYLAMAGALATGSLSGGFAFMTLFGLGTIPMLFALTMGFGFLSFDYKRKLGKILPYVSLVFGFFLIYRGVVVEMPTTLNFWEALKNPVMCH